MFAMTAAHKTLPIPSYARVTNVKNGKSVVVRINDRGPFHVQPHHRPVLRRRRAHRPRRRGQRDGGGGARVRRDGCAQPSARRRPPPPSPPAAAAGRRGRGAAAAPRRARASGCSSAPSPAPRARRASATQVARELPWILEPIAIEARDGLHRVRLGPYRNRDEAGAIADKVRRVPGLLALRHHPLMAERAEDSSPRCSRSPRSAAPCRPRLRAGGDAAADRRARLHPRGHPERPDARRRARRTTASSPPRSPS